MIVSASVWLPCLWIAMLQPKFKHNLFLQLWFKHDLRIDDHPGLHHALSRQQGVVPLFCFDPGHQNLLRTPHGIEGKVWDGGQQCALDGAVRAARGQQATETAMQHSEPRHWCVLPMCIQHILKFSSVPAHTLLRPQTGVPEQRLWCLDIVCCHSMQCRVHIPALGLLLLCCRGAACFMARHSAHQVPGDIRQGAIADKGKASSSSSSNSIAVETGCLQA